MSILNQFVSKKEHDKIISFRLTEKDFKKLQLSINLNGDFKNVSDFLQQKCLEYIETNKSKLEKLEEKNEQS